jgi:hypothetical protein
MIEVVGPTEKTGSAAPCLADVRAEPIAKNQFAGHGVGAFQPAPG